MKNSIIFLVVAGIVISAFGSCQKEQEHMFIELSIEFGQGQDGFKYVLTKSEFVTPYDLPIQQIQAEHGDGSAIADWNDLKANFGNDFSGFIQELGLVDKEKHEGFFITKEGENPHLLNRYYMVIGCGNQKYSDWVFFDEIGKNSKLIVTQRFDSGRVLLKIPIAPDDIN